MLVGTTGESGHNARPAVVKVRSRDLGNVTIPKHNMAVKLAKELILKLSRATTTSVQVWPNLFSFLRCSMLRCCAHDLFNIIKDHLKNICIGCFLCDVNLFWLHIICFSFLGISQFAEGGLCGPLGPSALPPVVTANSQGSESATIPNPHMGESLALELLLASKIVWRKNAQVSFALNYLHHGPIHTHFYPFTSI